MPELDAHPRIAYFISYHGFGHASRAAAVMAAMKRIHPGVHFELFTNCPIQIFESSLDGDFGYFEVASDVGVVQRSPLEEDYEATCQRLSAWLPFDPQLVDRVVKHIRSRGCRLVVCDISPLGVAAAKGAGLPCVLIENFTWDYIYEHFFDQVPALETFSYYLKNIFSQVDLHIQTAPVCRPDADAVQVPPVGRTPRTAPEETRAQLGIPPEAGMVMVSMGGVQDPFRFLQHLPEVIAPYIVIPNAEQLRSPHEKVVLLPTHSRFYHPDLLQAADLLIGKAGYSTLAEVYQTGVPFVYVPRPQSPETESLERFIQQQLSGRAITATEYNEGRWIGMLPDLLKLPRSRPPEENGADTVAKLLLEKYFFLNGK